MNRKKIEILILALITIALVALGGVSLVRMVRNERQSTATKTTSPQSSPRTFALPLQSPGTLVSPKPAATNAAVVSDLTKQAGFVKEVTIAEVKTPTAQGFSAAWHPTNPTSLAYSPPSASGGGAYISGSSSVFTYSIGQKSQQVAEVVAQPDLLAYYPDGTKLFWRYLSGGKDFFMESFDLATNKKDEFFKTRTGTPLLLGIDEQTICYDPGEGSRSIECKDTKSGTTKKVWSASYSVFENMINARTGQLFLAENRVGLGPSAPTKLTLINTRAGQVEKQIEQTPTLVSSTAGDVSGALKEYPYDLPVTQIGWLKDNLYYVKQEDGTRSIYIGTTLDNFKKILSGIPASQGTDPLVVHPSGTLAAAATWHGGDTMTISYYVAPTNAQYIASKQKSPQYGLRVLGFNSDGSRLLYEQCELGIYPRTCKLIVQTVPTFTKTTPLISPDPIKSNSDQVYGLPYAPAN